MFHDYIDANWILCASPIIRGAVNQIIGQAGFREQDREDLEQDLLLHVLRRLKSFDPAKGKPGAFVSMLVKRQRASILRDRRALKRRGRAVVSLHVLVPVDENDLVELGQTISRRENDARRQCHPRSDEEMAQLQADVRDTIAKLPPDQRTLAERLQHQTPSEIARQTGVPRTTLYELIRPIRRRFERAGLKDYIG
jgi:RNA polymerase sigma-70 factor (ECF subfamily)